ncbi:MAG: AMP-binding protein, partial [Gemmobacter sp.]
MGWLADETGLDRTAANFVPLTPLSHLTRAADIWPDHEALVYGPHRRSYRQYRDRVTRLASALAQRGVRPGDVVATIIPNLPAQVEAHFGVPACGAVLNTINTRLDVDTVAYILGHGGARVLLADTAFLPLAEAAVAAMEGPRPEIIEVADPHAGFPATGR